MRDVVIAAPEPVAHLVGALGEDRFHLKATPRKEALRLRRHVRQVLHALEDDDLERLHLRSNLSLLMKLCCVMSHPARPVLVSSCFSSEEFAANSALILSSP